MKSLREDYEWIADELEAEVSSGSSCTIGDEDTNDGDDDEVRSQVKSPVFAHSMVELQTNISQPWAYFAQFLRVQRLNFKLNLQVT